MDRGRKEHWMAGETAILLHVGTLRSGSRIRSSTQILRVVSDKFSRSSGRGTHHPLQLRPYSSIGHSFTGSTSIGAVRTNPDLDRQRLLPQRVHFYVPWLICSITLETSTFCSIVNPVIWPQAPYDSTSSSIRPMNVVF